MKENYEELKLEVIAFEMEDVITASQQEENPPKEPDCPNDCIM